MVAKQNDSYAIKGGSWRGKALITCGFLHAFCGEESCPSYPNLVKDIRFVPLRFRRQPHAAIATLSDPQATDAQDISLAPANCSNFHHKNVAKRARP